MTGQYILDGHKPVVCEDLLKWAKWFKKADRRVARTQIGDVEISTVFLGLNHGFGKTLILFETMIFGGEFGQDTWRYSTWEQAEKGHEEVVKSYHRGSHS